MTLNNGWMMILGFMVLSTALKGSSCTEGETSVECIFGINTYVTPAKYTKFSNFKIYQAIPSDGRSGQGTHQDAITIRDFDRKYISFNFKGKGYAQILFQEDESRTTERTFTVEIGGGTNNNKVTIYNNRLGSVVAQTTIDGITSEIEFRSFWIQLDRDNSNEVMVGVCNDPGENQILQTSGDYLHFLGSYISISTTAMHSGEWQFASDGEKLGGCKVGAGTPCSDSSLECVESGSFLHGTCILDSEQVPSDGFGTGICRTTCGTSAVCADGETCDNGACISATTAQITNTTTPITKTKTTTLTTTPTTPSITPTASIKTPSPTTLTTTISAPITSTTISTTMTRTSTISNIPPSTTTPLPTTTTKTSTITSRTLTSMIATPTTATTTPTTTTTTIQTTTTASIITPTKLTTTTPTPTTTVSTPTTTTTTPITTTTTPTISTTTPRTTTTTSTSTTTAATTMPTTPTNTTITLAPPTTYKTSQGAQGALTAATEASRQENNQSSSVDVVTVAGVVVGGLVFLAAVGGCSYLVMACAASSKISPSDDKNKNDEEQSNGSLE